jgi:hypothetical protein
MAITHMVRPALVSPNSFPSVTSQQTPIVWQFSLQNALNQLSKENHCCFICEDLPFRSYISGKAADTLKQTMADRAIPLYAKVQEIAKAFDYTIQQKSPDTYFLLKNFTDPEDLPDVTFEEVRRSFQNLMAVIQDFYGTEDAANTLAAFYASLNTETKDPAGAFRYGNVG